MNVLEAMSIVDGLIDIEEPEQYFEAYQVLIDTAYVWTMPGRYGREAQALIDNGDCHE